MFQLPKRENDGVLEKSKPTRRLDELIVDASIRRSLRLVKLECKLRGELARNGLKPRHRMLFHGPPGNGKTAACECLAAMLDVPLFTARYDQIIGSYLGELEKGVVSAFRAACGVACVLFFDEARNNATNLILQELDRLDPRVIFIAATNRFDELDPAVKRRFDATLCFAPPTDEQKAEYLAAAIERMPVFKTHPAAALEARRLDAPSFSELECELKNLARELILRKLRDDYAKNSQASRQEKGSRKKADSPQGRNKTGSQAPHREGAQRRGRKSA